MQQSMAAQRLNADPDDRIQVYRQQIKQLAELRKVYNEAAMASGDWHVQTVKHVSASEAFTDRVRKQKLGIMELTRAYSQYRKTGGGALGEAIKEQTALRNATATQLTSSVFGKNITDLHLPKNLGPELDNARVKLGLIGQAIGAASTQMVNWGKNTQWAGRQITVGLTMPLGMAAVGAAAFALKVDQELTRVAKVYDTVNQEGIAQEQELADVRRQSLETATRMAHEYGAAMDEVLKAQANLAATGLSGSNLQNATEQVTRIATLGEMDFEAATEATISLQTAFRHQVKTTDDLAEAFNYFNAVENSTSLQLSDIAEAIPRVASAFAGLGGTVQDMTIQLVAMREAGVDPAEAANALKSATASLLDPTKEAIDYFKQSFGIDLPKVVADSNGNLLQMNQTLAGLTAGFEPDKIQAGISILFGKYQFNRASALWKNLGDAVNGVQNQTWQAMQLGHKTTEELAALADEEVTRLQNSISGKFRAAVEGFKAELVPLGETILQFVTPILSFITMLVSGFNDLSGPVKAIILSLLGIGAVVGPLLMIVGIFANLFGNVIKFGASLSNMRTKFRAMNADEAAAEIMAKRAASAFNSEAGAVAQLTLQIKALSEAMEQNAVASGIMMNAAGRIGDRQVIPGANGSTVYAPGSRNQAGKDIGGKSVDPEDLARWQAIHVTSESVSEESERTKRNWAGIATTVGTVAAIGIPLFAGMLSDSDGMASNILGIAMSLAAVGQLGGFGFISNLFGKADSDGKKFTDRLKSGFDGVIERTKTFSSNLRAGGIRGAGGQVINGVKGIGSGLGNVAGTALRIFGPIGILAGGLFILNELTQASRELYEAQGAVNQSAQAWASVLGYTYSPGVIAGNQEMADTMASRRDEVEALTEAAPELVSALQDAGAEMDDFAKAAQMATMEGLKVVASGGTVAEARQAFRVALQAAGAEAGDIDRLAVEFDSIELSNPDQVREALRQQVQNAIQGIPISIGSQTTTSGIFNVPVLSDEAAAAARETGSVFGNAFEAAANDQQRGQIFAQMEQQFMDQFEPNFDQWYSDLDEETRQRFADMGITSLESFQREMENAGPEFSEGWLEFWSQTGLDPSSLPEPLMAYQAALDALYTGMIDQGLITQAQLDEILSLGGIGNVAGLNRLQNILGVVDPEPIVSLEHAMAEYETQVNEATYANGGFLDDARKLELLNMARLSAGLEPAVDLAQGFGQAAATAAGQVDALAAATAGIAVTAEMAMTQLRSTYEGTMSDIYSEADRRMGEMHEAEVEGIRNAGERRQKALDNQGKRNDKHWDKREKALEKNQENETKIFEKGWDDREKAEEEYWEGRERQLDDAIDLEELNTDNRVKAIEDTMEAERKADEERQRIFDREKARIQRMAQLHNTNIDFNAALNTGDLDEAARIFSTNQATTAQWGIEDQAEDTRTAMEKRHDEMEAEIEAIEAESEARVAALERQKEAVQAEAEAAREQLRLTREAETEALQQRQQEASEWLKTQRDMQREALDARREADRQSTESTLRRVQNENEADRRGLASRLRELQAFTPRNQEELANHIAKVEALYGEYGLNLKAQGNSWAGHVSGSLDKNMKIAATKLQDDINWQGMGQVIADRLSANLSITPAALQFFMKNGRFPNTGFITGIADKILARAQGITGAFHGGGEIGGPAFSAKDRTGVPRSASPYPSEMVTLLKRGEYVVNEKATRNNLGLLNAINSSRHEGGIASGLAQTVGGMGVLLGGVIGMGVQNRLTEGNLAGGVIKAARGSEAVAGGGAFSGAAAGTSQTDRMFNTIRQHFPRVKLNDALRPGANDMHGRGKAIDIGLQGVPGGAGNQYMADMNRWIHDNIPNVYELIYTGIGDDRPDLKRGRPLNYGAAINRSHTNHVHWAMEAFHRGGWLPQLKAGGFTLSEGLANLHPGEAVLTKPLTQQFVNNVASGGDSGYTVNIDLRGSTIREDVDIERAVERAIERRESRNGRRRVV